jgi:hypothetical protein
MSMMWVTLRHSVRHTLDGGNGELLAGPGNSLRGVASMSASQPVRDYETQMIGYGFDAVRKSLAQMDGDAPAHRPVVGPVLMSGMRAGMRLVNHLPPVKRRMADGQRRYRGADRER